MATANAQGLKDAIGKYCLIGAAVNQWQSDGQVPEADVVLKNHFNCAVAENCMKPEVLAPAEAFLNALDCENMDTRESVRKLDKMCEYFSLGAAGGIMHGKYYVR